jgi:hypothetical protein
VAPTGSLENLSTAVSICSANGARLPTEVELNSLYYFFTPARAIVNAMVISGWPIGPTWAKRTDGAYIIYDSSNSSYRGGSYDINWWGQNTAYVACKK